MGSPISDHEVLAWAGGLIALLISVVGTLVVLLFNMIRGKIEELKKVMREEDDLIYVKIDELQKSLVGYVRREDWLIFASRIEASVDGLKQFFTDWLQRIEDRLNK